MENKKNRRLNAVKGMFDLLPPVSRRLREVEKTCHRVLPRFGYLPICTPIVEYTPLFARSIGEDTDIVEKEMYTFEDRDGRSLTMRPEGTASTVRAYIEHAVYKREPVTQWYYLGPMFRHEKSQRGRYRQFYQLGVEALGVSQPGIEAEMLQMLFQLLRELGLSEMALHLNSLGCPKCRPAYRGVLVDFLMPHEPSLCENCQRRFRNNPLRVLDCKVEECKRVAADAPKMLDHLCQGCQIHWDHLVENLSVMEVAFEKDHRLVRGLDYYCRTTFEMISTSANLGSQNTIAGGGRYDGLVEILSGPPTPAVGFAMGLERLLLALDDKPIPPPLCQVTIATQGRPAYHAGLAVARKLRAEDMIVDVDHRETSIKSQLKRANRRGSAIVLLLGESELEKGVVSMRLMDSSSQTEVQATDVVAKVKQELSARR